MPNLRKRSSVLTYNDDAIYRAIENQRRISKNCNPKISKSPTVAAKGKKESVFVEEGDNKIPEFVYASDGRKFFPCLFCCHAFALKELQIGHMQQCSFRLQELLEPPVSATMPSKLQHVSKPKISGTRSRKTNNGPKNVRNKIQQFKMNPKLIVPKSKHFAINPAIGNGTMKIVKQRPKKTDFPKIKLEPGTGNQKNTEHAHLRVGAQNNRFIKNMNFQPRLGGQGNKLVVKHSRNIKQRAVNACPHCNFLFESLASLVRHKREKHTFPKIYVPADKLKEYDEMYKNSDMSKCTLCAKPVTKVRWSRHLQTHINERKYFCNFCERSFGRKDHRNVHEKKHILDVENPFVDSEVHNEAMQMTTN